MVWSRSRRPDPGVSLRLCRYERKLLAASLVLLPATMVAHRILGYRRLQSLLERFLPASASTTDTAGADLTLAESVSRVVRIASNRLLPHPTCLQQSIYLRWLLARMGLAADLRIGVRKSRDRFEAHAWIEYRGRVLNDSEDVQSRYTALTDRVPPSLAGDT